MLFVVIQMKEKCKQAEKEGLYLDSVALGTIMNSVAIVGIQAQSASGKMTFPRKTRPKYMGY